MAASVSSGRPPFFSSTRSRTLARLAASESVTETCSSAGCAAEGSGAVELGRMVMIGVPVATLDLTIHAPPKIGCSQTRSALTPTASVMTPPPVLTASRAATSLPSALQGIKTAAGIS